MDYSRTTAFWTFFLFPFYGLTESTEQGAAFIEWLVSSNVTDLNQIHVIGFSLGVLVGASTCAQVHADTGHKVERMTGL